MNIEQANAILLHEILAKLNLVPVKDNGLDLWYYSPFRKENTPSFHVNTLKNVWYDFGDGRGGKPIDFVIAWLGRTGEDKTHVDALRWLRNMMLHPAHLIRFPKQRCEELQSALTVTNIAPVQQKGLLAYLKLRGIPEPLAAMHLKEVFLTNSLTGKQFYALGMRNEENGYELRNMFFKGTLAPKHITFVRGTKTSGEEINVFEGWTDFLSALVHQKHNRFEGDTIILNSLSCISKALPYIEVSSYKKLRTWLDNDAAGETATKAFNRFAAAQGNIEFEPMNRLYAPHKDVNAWHVQKLKL